MLAASFGDADKAALRVSTNGGAIVATDRTYNLLGQGNAMGLPPGATFGQFVPGVDLTAAVTPDSEGRMVHLSHDPSGTQGFRTNLVLVNGTRERASLVVELFTADATPLGTLEYNLRAFEYKQINSVIARVTEEVVEDGYAVVSMNGSGEAVFALASVVDNLTGDPVGMMATTVFHFEISRGHNYLLASADGIDWEVINEVPPPDNPGDPPRNGYYDGILPASVMGSDEL